MGLFDVSEADAVEWKEKFRQIAQEHVDEPVIAAAPFRRGGAGAQMVTSKAGLGAVVYAGIGLFQKKKAGGLPARVFLVVTPTKLHAFTWTFKGRNYKLKDEAAVWDRAGLRTSTEPKMGLTMLTIESPAEGEKATLAPGGVKDDPFSEEVIRALQDNVTTPPAATSA